MSVSGISESYKPSQWVLREDYYKQQIDLLELPIDIDARGIVVLLSGLDKVFQEARLELGYTKRKLENLDRVKRSTESELFLTIKAMNLAGVKTVDEVNGAVTIAMKSVSATDALVDKPLDAADKARMIADITTVLTGGSTGATPIPTGYITLGHALRTAEERCKFMESVVKILDQKYAAIISVEGALKMEANLDGRSSIRT